MPSSTFLNLPLEKREKLLAAATREFSRRPFNEASINRIIKDAGIPRGSFYMYFLDKEELFRYLLQGCVDQLLAVMEDLLRRRNGDIFQALTDLYDDMAERRAAPGGGELDTLCDIIDRNRGMQKGSLLEMLAPDAVLRRLEGAVDPSLLELRQERDLADILSLLVMAVTPMLYNAGTPGTRAQLVNVLDILKRGMGRPADEMKENGSWSK